MDKDILQRIEEKLPKMTSQQQLIALAVLKDPLKIAFSSVREFAESVGVSAASIVRFSQLFTDGGFPEMQEELQVYIQMASNPLQRFELNFSPTTDEAMLVTKIYETQLTNLQNTFTSTFVSSTIEAAKLITQARHIYTLGSRGSRSTAYYLGHHLNRVFQNADPIPDDDRLADQLLRATPDDVAIIFALPRYSKRLLSAARRLHNLGLKVITVNNSPKSPFVPYSDIPLYVSYQSNDFHNSQLSSMLLAEIIISLVINNDRKTALQSLDAIENCFNDMEQFTAT